MSEIKCPFCVDSGTSAVIHTKFVICDRCGLFINRPMSPETIKEVNKNFLLSACKNPKTRASRLKEADEVQMKTIEEHTTVGNVYDVGAASGFFLKAARDRGWNIGGNEISVKGIEWAKENYDMDLDYGFLEEVDVKKDHYNAVVLWNTLEHTHNPKTTLDTCYHMLKDGGLLYIKVPNKKTINELNRYYETVHLFEFTDECITFHLKSMGFVKLWEDTNCLEEVSVGSDIALMAGIYLYKKECK